MKHIFTVFSLFFALVMNAQVNLIANGDFENFAAGDSSYLTTGTGDVTGKPGVWQLSVYGNTASSLAQAYSKIVDTTSFSGSKSLAITIRKQSTQWAIRLFQSMPAVEADKYVVTFYLKSNQADMPVSVDVLKSTFGYPSVATAPFAVQFKATKNWKQFKMYIDVTGWTAAERNNMRISIRPNSVVGSTLPAGPFPKICWIDNVSVKKIDPLTELKDVAVGVAMERMDLSKDAGFAAEAAALQADIQTLINSTPALPAVPEKAIGFNPAIKVSTNNIHIDAIHAWAATYLTKPLSLYPSSEPNNSIIPKSKTGKDTIYTGDKYNDSREMGELLQRLHWLIVSPYSNYRYNPELFRRFLHLVYATSDDYKTYCYAVGGSVLPGGTANAMNDWFAISEISYAWRIASVSFGQFLPSTMLQQMKDAALVAGKLHYETLAPAIFSGNYANRDISYAEVLMHTGMFVNNQNWINLSKQIVDSMLMANLYPDGAHAYIWHQNESGSYHTGNNTSLAKIWAVSEYQNAWDCIAKGANYEMMTIEGSGVPEYYTVPAWKTTWNGIPGFSGEPLLGITGNPWLKTKFDNYRTGSNSVYNIPFYRTDIVAKPIPDNYVVYDRNIQGPRGRYGRFSYAATVRNVAGTGSTNQPGLQTVMGSMQTRPLGTSTTKDNLDAAVMCIHNKVHVNPGNTSEWDTWGYMLANVKSKVCVAQTASTVSASGILQRQTAGPSGRNTDWSSYQQWITLPDRIIGFFEVYPTGASAGAYQVDGRVRFTYGRSGTMYPKSIKKEIDQKQYAYGKFRAFIHGHDFQTVLTDTAGVIRDDVKQAEEIIFRFDESGGGVTKKTYSSAFKKYFIIEIRDSLSKTDAQVSRVINGNIKALVVKLNGKCYASFKNTSAIPQTADLSTAIIPGNTNEIHFSRLDTMVNLPVRITNSTYTIPANEQILLVSSNDPADLGRGFQNYTELLKLNGKMNTDIKSPVINSTPTIRIENVVKNKINRSMIATIICHDTVKATLRLVDTNGAVLFQQNNVLSEGINNVLLPETSSAKVVILQVVGEKGDAVSRKISH